MSVMGWNSSAWSIAWGSGGVYLPLHCPLTPSGCPTGEGSGVHDTKRLLVWQAGDRNASLVSQGLTSSNWLQQLQTAKASLGP